MLSSAEKVTPKQLHMLAWVLILFIYMTVYFLQYTFPSLRARYSSQVATSALQLQLLHHLVVIQLKCVSRVSVPRRHAVAPKVISLNPESLIRARALPQCPLLRRYLWCCNIGRRGYSLVLWHTCLPFGSFAIDDAIYGSQNTPIELPLPN